MFELRPECSFVLESSENLTFCSFIYCLASTHACDHALFVPSDVSRAVFRSKQYFYCVFIDVFHTLQFKSVPFSLFVFPLKEGKEMNLVLP